MITLGGYNACLLDLVCDPKTKAFSATKIWMHVGNIIMSKVLLTQATVGWELLLAYGAVVGGSHVAIYWLKQKYPTQVEKNPPD